MEKFSLVFAEYFSSDVVDFQSLSDTGDLLRIILSAKDELIVIDFKDHLFYRKMEEGDAYKYSINMNAQVPIGKVFYRAENSELLIWLHQQSFGAKNPKLLQHYIVAAENDWIDVISWGAPVLWKDKRTGGISELKN